MNKSIPRIKDWQINIYSKIIYTSKNIVTTSVFQGYSIYTNNTTKCILLKGMLWINKLQQIYRRVLFNQKGGRDR